MTPSRLYNLIAFAQAYSNLGWSVQGQLAEIVDGCLDDLNPNAIKAMRSLLDPVRAIDDDLGSELEAQLDEAAVAEAKTYLGNG